MAGLGTCQVDHSPFDRRCLAVFGIFAPPWIAERLQAPTCEDPRDLRLATPDQVEGQSKPADNFPKKGIVAYGVANLVDGNTSTAWVEDRQGLGLGSPFTLHFQSPVDVRLVCLVDGYAESWDLYKRNSRARLLTVDTQQGTRAALLRDAGSPDQPAVYQRVNVAPGMTPYLTLTIKGAYAAQRDTTATLAYSDTSISEVEVWTAH
jgi:hypothetical protein